MKGIIETIRLFRKKDDDIWAIFLIEFFKLIGCSVYDYVLPYNVGIDVNAIIGELYNKCDTNIFWNFDAQETEIKKNAKINGEESKLIFVNNIEKTEKMFEYFRENGIKIFRQQVIDILWNEDEDNKNMIGEIASAYTKWDLFFYWYHRGSLRFVQEYYPLDGKDEKIQEKRKQIYIKTFECYKNCYNELLQSYNNSSYYYQYTMLNLENELNCLGKLITGGYVFDVGSLVDKAKQIEKKYPACIRIEFLKAIICETDSYFMWDAETYYINARKRFKREYGEQKFGIFFDYKLGKYYEKKQKNYEKAETCYQEACKRDPMAYRARFKLAKIKERNGNFDEAVSDANHIIRIVLNGFNVEELMPRRQIYIYKAFVLLGDIYTKMECYFTAVEAYEKALKVSNCRSLYYQDQDDIKVSDLLNVIKACMPKQPVYGRMIKGLSQLGDRKMVDKYLKIMLTGDEDEGEKGKSN